MVPSSVEAPDQVSDLDDIGGSALVCSGQFKVAFEVLSPDNLIHEGAKRAGGYVDDSEEDDAPIIRWLRRRGDYMIGPRRTDRVQRRCRGVDFRVAVHS